MRYTLFLGCTIPARERNYELSARKVAEKVGIVLEDEKDFICCGFPIRNADKEMSILLSAYNLALAQKRGTDLCALCSSCTSALTETAHLLAEDSDMREEVNRRLARVGLEYNKDVKVRHFARLLYEDVGQDRLKTYFRKDLNELGIAIHYGCHYLKPSEIFNGFDDPEDPQTLDALVDATGAKIIDYKGKKRCCGGPVLPINEKTALRVAKEKLDDISKAGADAVCLVCPFCAVMYDSNQKGIKTEFGVEYGLPVLYLTQLLGIAMGFERKELGLNLNVVKTKGLLKRGSNLLLTVL